MAAKIDELERRIEAGGSVTEGDLDQLWQMYEDVQEQRDLNVPDVWKTSTESTNKPRTETGPSPTRSARPTETEEQQHRE